MRLFFLALVAAGLAGLAWFLTSERSNPVVPDLGGPVEPIGKVAGEGGLGVDPLEGGAGDGRVTAAPAAGSPVAPDIAGALADGEHPWGSQFPGVTGRVVEADGEPAAGLAVSLLEFSIDTVFSEDMVAMPHETLEASRTVTGADGRFHLEGTTATGVHGLGIDMGGARSTVRFIDDSLAYGNVTDLGDIVLSLHGTVVGLVIDEDGEPVEGARVRFAVVPDLVAQAGAFDIRADALLASPDGSGVLVAPIPSWAASLIDRLPVSTGLTGADGEFRIDGVPAGRVVGGADHAGFTAALAEPFELAAGAEHDAGELELLLGRTAQGRVVDGAGNAVPGAFLVAGTMKPVIEVGFLHPAPMSDEDGHFSIGGLPELGDVVVAARRSARDPWVSIVTPRAPRGLVITLPTAPSLAIELVDNETGEPVLGATFELRARTKTDRFNFVSMLRKFNRQAFGPSVIREEGEGRYVVEALPVGDWSLVARESSYAPLEAEFTHSSPPLDQAFRMSRGRHVPIAVVDGSTDEPIPAAHVALMSADPSFLHAFASGWTDIDGVLELGPLSLDGYLARASGESGLMGGVSVIVQHPSYGRHVFPFVLPPVSEDQALETLKLALLPTVELNGRVTWDGESPSVRYMATLQLDGSDTGELPRFAITSEDGHFVFRGLIPGSYRLEVVERFLNGDPLRLLAGDSRTRPMNGPAILIDDAEPAFVEFNLSAVGEEKPGWVAGSVRLNGQPLAGAKIRVGRHSDAGLFTDGSGEFRSGELKPAYVGFSVQILGQEALDGVGEADWETVYSNSIRIHGGGEARLDLELEDSELEVLVLDSFTGEPLGEAEIAKDGSEVGTTGPSGLATIKLRIPRLAGTPAFGAVLQTRDSMSVSLEGYDTQWFSVDRPAALESKNRPMELRLQPSIPCKGTVVLPSGFIREGVYSYIVLERELGGGRSISESMQVDLEALTF
ncbi:MAG: hypothetical protein ACJA0P_004260, partial [Planctomycetota bacterium]